MERLQDAVRFHNYGNADQLKIDKIPIGKPAANQVLIKIIATGINPIDWKIREGFKNMPLPFIPGSEGSGIVEEAGTEVKDFTIGQAVYGAIDHSYAEYAVAQADMIFAKPQHLSFEEAAVVGGGKTAWGALFDVGSLRSGQRILIHGASGGVGIFAVQLAHQVGAYVIATTSKENAAFIKELGANEVIDYQHEDFLATVSDVDMVLDCVGGDSLQRSYGVIKKGGILISIVEMPSKEKAEQMGIRAMWGGTKSVSTMKEIADRLDKKIIYPVIRKVFTSLSQAGEAQNFSQSGGKGRGKIVLKVSI